jgi:hypothetical protein
VCNPDLAALGANFALVARVADLLPHLVDSDTLALRFSLRCALLRQGTPSHRASRLPAGAKGRGCPSCS